MFGPITNEDQIVWQRQAVVVLADILVDAVRTALPCMHWEISSGRTIIARCLHRGDPARRAAFTAWASYFSIADRKEWDSAGMTHLQASRTDFRGCTVVVIADLYQDVEGAGERP
jgi:hypothetical protein